MPGSTTYIDTPKIEYLPLEYAFNPATGGSSQPLHIIPTVYGDHSWSVSYGYSSSGQAPYIAWNDKRYMQAFTQRATTILMVFAV